MNCNCDCRCHAKKTQAREKQRQFRQHLTRTEDIIALKAKRLNETGKVYFLESTYTQITVTFLAEFAAQCTEAKRTFGTLIRAMTRKTKLLTCTKKNHRKKSNQPKNRKKKQGLFSWQHLNPTSIFSFFLSLPPTLRHQVKLQT